MPALSPSLATSAGAQDGVLSRRKLLAHGVSRSGTVEMVSARHVRAEPVRLRVSRRRVPQDHVTDLDGLPVAPVVRTLADLVARLDRPDALAVLDSALRQGLIDADGLCVARAAGGDP